MSPDFAQCSDAQALRKPDTTANNPSIIKIGHDIEIIITEIRITEIHSDQVRIGIHAPRDIAVHRREIYDELTAESQFKKAQSLK